jgi:hypothetical protein
MENLWTEYINGNLPLDVLVKDAYALEHSFKPEWLDMTDETVEDYVKRLLSELESEGYNLDKTPIEILKQKFVEESIVVNAPLAYINLSSALSELKKQIRENVEKGMPDWIVSRLTDTKDQIEQELKRMK